MLQYPLREVSVGMYQEVMQLQRPEQWVSHHMLANLVLIEIEVFGNNAKLCGKTPGVDDTILATSLIIAVMGTVSQIFIAMRLYSRRYITGELAIDDYLIMGSAFMIFTVMCLGTVSKFSVTARDLNPYHYHYTFLC